MVVANKEIKVSAKMHEKYNASFKRKFEMKKCLTSDLVKEKIVEI
jgi:ribosomal protein S17E